jgi:hypothetical protein
MNFGRYTQKTQKPQMTPAAAAWEANGVPEHTSIVTHGLDMGDEGMVGSHTADKVSLRNAHPHQAHSTGYDDSSLGVNYTNHGISAVNIKHGRRDKGAEHHPPSGLWDPTAVDHTPSMRGVFTDG